MLDEMFRIYLHPIARAILSYVSTSSLSLSGGNFLYCMLDGVLFRKGAWHCAEGLLVRKDYNCGPGIFIYPFSPAMITYLLAPGDLPEETGQLSPVK